MENPPISCLDPECSESRNDTSHRKKKTSGQRMSISLDNLVSPEGCDQCIDLRMKVHSLQAKIVEIQNKRNTFESTIMDALKTLSVDVSQIKAAVMNNKARNAPILYSPNSVNDSKDHVNIQLASLLGSIRESDCLIPDSSTHDILESILTSIPRNS